MMRHLLIEKAAHAVHARAVVEGAEHLEWDHLPLWLILQYRADAKAALDAVLPQVTTVAELDEVAIGSRLIDTNGDAYRPSAHGLLVSDSGTLIRVDAAAVPLTVVWQPEVSA